MPQTKLISDKQRDKLLNMKNVNSVGVGFKIRNGVTTNEISIVVGVAKKEDIKDLPPDSIIPKEVDNIITDVIVIGDVYALDLNLRRKMRPALGGISVGHHKITAGTLGTIYNDGSKKMMLSNNHVFANSNNASKGDVILQPGSYDGGNPITDKIGKLEIFEPIYFDGDDAPDKDKGCPIARIFSTVVNFFTKLIGSKTRIKPERINSLNAKGNNIVDVAIATPDNQNDVEIGQYLIGRVEGTNDCHLGMKIEKIGRTTGLTIGNVLLLDMTVKVNFGSSGIATFTDQIGITSNMVEGGDSGSLVLDTNKNAVGLIFAGSNTIGIMNNIRNVEKSCGGIRLGVN